MCSVPASAASFKINASEVRETICFPVSNLERCDDMETILIIVLLVVLFGGGGGYYWSRRRY